MKIFKKYLLLNISNKFGLILNNAFTKEFMVNLRKKSFELYKSKPSEFHKMLEGAPDFHRVIDIEIGKKYAIKMCKHSFYFYPWNEDPLKIFEPIYEKRKYSEMTPYIPRRQGLFETLEPRAPKEPYF